MLYAVTNYIFQRHLNYFWKHSLFTIQTRYSWYFLCDLHENVKTDVFIIRTYITFQCFKIKQCNEQKHLKYFSFYGLYFIYTDFF